MDKKEEFKTFIKDKEFLIDKVNNGETTWQKLYEIYDLYGDNEDVWREFLKDENASSNNNSNSLDVVLSLCKMILCESDDYFCNNC